MYTSQTQTGPLGQSRLSERVRARAGEVYDRTDELVREHPASSALATFAVGCSLGLAAALLLFPPIRRRTWSETHLPNWASRCGLSQAIDRLVPDAVTRYLSRDS